MTQFQIMHVNLKNPGTISNLRNSGLIDAITFEMFYLADLKLSRIINFIDRELCKTQKLKKEVELKLYQPLLMA